MILSRNGEQVHEFTPEYGGKKIVIAIDSSKSNTAIVVGDTEGHILNDYEISGAGSDTDVYDLCRDTRNALRQLFHGADIQLIGIEDIITKKEANYKGLEVHQSRAKITAVFNNLIFFFDEVFNKMPRFIPNQSWKASVLPEEFRKRTHKKGSKDWFDELGNRWAGRKDDVTDAVCIYIFLMKTEEIKVEYSVRETKPAECEYTYGLFPITFKSIENYKKFVIENNDSIEHNMATIAGRLDKNEYGYFAVDISRIPIEWIYSDKLKFSAMSTYQREDKKIYIAVQRV